MEVRFKARRILHKLLLAALPPTALAVALLIAINVNMMPTVRSYARARVEMLAADAMNRAILESTYDAATYSSLVTLIESPTGFVMLQADTQAMNRLAASCTEAALEKIAELGEQGVSVPIGTLSGIPQLTGRGPKVKITFVPEGSVTSVFRSEFSSAGINQTLYRVYIRLTATVQIALARGGESITAQTEAAIAESIIVGNVPQVYTDVSNQEDMLNLIPTELP